PGLEKTWSAPSRSGPFGGADGGVAPDPMILTRGVGVPSAAVAVRLVVWAASFSTTPEVCPRMTLAPSAAAAGTPPCKPPAAARAPHTLPDRSPGWNGIPGNLRAIRPGTGLAGLTITIPTLTLGSPVAMAASTDWPTYRRETTRGGIDTASPAFSRLAPQSS